MVKQITKKRKRNKRNSAGHIKVRNKQIFHYYLSTTVRIFKMFEKNNFNINFRTIGNGIPPLHFLICGRGWSFLYPAQRALQWPGDPRIAMESFRSLSQPIQGISYFKFLLPLIARTLPFPAIPACMVYSPKLWGKANDSQLFSV